MKPTILFLAAVFFVSTGFSQVDELDSYEDFQIKINNFRALIETNGALMADASDEETESRLADEIRLMGKELSQDVGEVFKCSNPDFGKKLAMSYAYAGVSPVLSNLYFNRAFVKDVCPAEKSKYSYSLDRIRHLAWRFKASSDEEKKSEFLSEMLETAASI
jgi:hypothetical protein